MRDVSVLMPARHEQFLNRTVEDLLTHAELDTEIIVVLDGAWPEVPLAQHPKVHLVYLPESIGQRAATNLAARLSQARYVCKADAHISVAQGWDRVLCEAGEKLGPDATIIPAQKNLHIYNRVCPCGRTEYQGPMTAPCVSCGQTEWTQDVVWKPRGGTTTTNWSFTAEPKFQYGGVEPQPSVDGIHDVMSSLGAFFFLRRERYEQIGGLDEAHGSWGNVGVEVAAKSWLSGGRHVCCTKTWFAHFFRVGGIGFPYAIKHSDQEKARDYSRQLWFNDAWSGQTRPLSWLVEKFWPIKGWTQADLDALRPAATVVEPKASDEPLSIVTLKDEPPTPQPLTKSILYYSDCLPDPRILEASRRTIERANLPIIAVTLKPIDWPAALNVVLPLERGPLTMFRQILVGLEVSTAELVFFAEHDCLYSDSQWDFIPPTPGTYFYNLNWAKVDAATGRALRYDAKQTSQLCAARALLLQHYRTRVDRVQREGYSRATGFEPGSHRRKERIDDVPSDVWRSPIPNIDIRHGANLTPSRWRQKDFRDPRNCQGWAEADGVPGWGQTKGRFWEFLESVSHETQQAVA